MTPNKDIKMDRVWEMPNKWTFKVKSAMQVIEDEGGFGLYKKGVWVDPFAGFNSPADITNDIEEDRPTTHHMDALEFLKSLDSEAYDGVLFDPPYSTEQCLRIYTPKQGGTAGRAEYWGKCKDEIKKLVKPGGKVISFGWDSVGMGKKRGFTITRIRLICHGACHNDTIITVEANK